MITYPNLDEEFLEPDDNLGAVKSKKIDNDGNVIYDIPEIELRYNKSASMEFVGKVTSSTKCAAFAREIIGIESIPIQEYFIVLFLNRANKIIGFHRQSKGGISGTVVDVRLILGVALKCFASGVILAHNHPSGEIVPSELDNSITKTVKEAGKMMDITVLDHLIITTDSYYSYADESLMGIDSTVNGLSEKDSNKQAETPKEKKINSLLAKAKYLKF